MMRIKQLAMVVGAAGAFAATAPAYAACGGNVTVQPSSWQAGGAAQTVLADFEGPEGIVGMWSVQFLVNGSVFDFGYQQWHRDGTEILNSGGRPPSTENFCLGVWERNGARYLLNHYALSYDPATGKLNGKVNIREDVGLGPRGETYAGTFSLQVIDPARGTALQRVDGRVTGKRIMINTGSVP